VSLTYIRQYYGVDAKPGGRVTFYTAQAQHRYGTIVGAKGQYLRVRPDDEDAVVTLHPTWQVDYEPENDPAARQVTS